MDTARFFVAAGHPHLLIAAQLSKAPEVRRK
jgi:hypothetical protein